MKEWLLKYWKILLSVGVGSIVAGLSYKIYPAHIIYQELFQFFRFDATYIGDRIEVPGGVACLFSDFLAQFCYNPKYGALIVAVLCILIQRLLWGCMKHQGITSGYYPLSFLPVITALRFMADENSLLSFLLSLVMCLWAMWGYGWLKSTVGRLAYICLVTPILYGAAGPVHFAFVIGVLLQEIARIIHRKQFKPMVVAGVALLWAGMCPYICSVTMQYSLQRLIMGIEYYRYPDVWLQSGIITVALLAFLPLGVKYFPMIRRYVGIWIGIQILVLSIGGYHYIKEGCNFEKEEALQYYCLATQQQWQKIIKKAEKKHPNSPFSMACLNLALAKQGELGNRMFEFSQQGTGGLLPAYVRDFT